MTSILFLAGREPDYIRNHVILKALRSKYRVTELTSEAGSTPLRLLETMARFVRRRYTYDVLFAGFYGQPLAIAMSKLQNRPIILDAYVSTFDTLCDDRRVVRPTSPVGRLAAWLDRSGCQVATQVITDTEADAGYFRERFDVPAEKLTTVYVGCDNSLFYPRPAEEVSSRVEVFYYGAFLPLQGVDVVVGAAARLKEHSSIHFTIGGHGLCFDDVARMVRDLGLHNVDLVGWIPFDDLPGRIAEATVCLGGHFSRIPKAARVVSTKTYQFIAMAKPTIVGANAATDELFRDGVEVVTVPMGDPDALAESILRLAGDPQLRATLGQGGYELYKRRLSMDRIADQLAEVVDRASCASLS